jgi:hypothetical protein
MSTPVPPSFPQSQPPLPPAKKPNILIWILGGIVVLMLGVTVMCGLGGYFLMRKAKQAGFDSSLLKSNPAYAAAKMAVTMNPDLESVTSDDDSGTITVREKKTGKVMNFKFDPDKKTMVITGEDGKETKFTANTDGDKGSLVVQGADGATVKIGATGSNDMPSWIPVYPGSSPKGTFSSQTKEGNQATYSFNTSDAPAKVMAYYQDQLKAGGFAISMATTTPQGGIVMAEDSGKIHTVMLTVGTSSDGTSVSVTSVEKK